MSKGVVCLPPIAEASVDADTRLLHADHEHQVRPSHSNEGLKGLLSLWSLW